MIKNKGRKSIFQLNRKLSPALQSEVDRSVVSEISRIKTQVTEKKESLKKLGERTAEKYYGRKRKQP
jgi:hypothetical protein